MLEKWTLIWACFDPPGVSELSGLSQACPLLKGGKWDLGDGPRPGVERRAPIPHPGYRGRSGAPGTRQVACAVIGNSVQRKGWLFASCLLHLSPLMGTLPGVAEPGVPAGALRGAGLEGSEGFLGTEDRIHVGQSGPGTERAVKASLFLPTDPSVSGVSSCPQSISEDGCR